MTLNHAFSIIFFFLGFAVNGPKKNNNYLVRDNFLQGALLMQEDRG